MTKAFTTDQVRGALTTYITQHGRATTAQRFGVSESMLYKVQQGATPPSEKILNGLGLVKRYVPAPTPTNKER